MTYSTFAPCSTKSSTTPFEYACELRRRAEVNSSTSVKREPASATTSSRQKSEPPGRRRSRRARRAASRARRPSGTWTSRPCSQTAALWAANLSSQPTRLPSSGWSSVSGSKRMPSAAPARISMPDSVDRRERRRRRGRASTARRPSPDDASAVPSVGVEALEVGEAPVLVARRSAAGARGSARQLSPHGARTSGGASACCRRGRGRCAMWQTPVSNVSPANSTPFASSAFAAPSSTSGTRSAIDAVCGPCELSARCSSGRAGRGSRSRRGRTRASRRGRSARGRASRRRSASTARCP